MFPVTVVNRFLKRQTPQIPLPPNIDEEYDSRSDSWLLVSKSQSSPRDPQAQTTSSIACQTSSFSETTNHRPRSQVRGDLPNFRSYTMVDFQNHPYIASLLLEHLWTLQCPHHLSSFLELQPNPFLHHQGFTTLPRNSVPLKNERKMTPLRRKIPFEISSMKLVLRANCTVKSINQPSLINILTELRTALALVAFLCTYRYGITGHAGAPASRILLLMFRYPWYLITYMLQTT